MRSHAHSPTHQNWFCYSSIAHAGPCDPDAAQERPGKSISNCSRAPILQFFCSTFLSKTATTSPRLPFDEFNWQSIGLRNAPNIGARAKHRNTQIITITTINIEWNRGIGYLAKLARWRYAHQFTSCSHNYSWKWSKRARVDRQRSKNV